MEYFSRNSVWASYMSLWGDVLISQRRVYFASGSVVKYGTRVWLSRISCCTDMVKNDSSPAKAESFCQPPQLEELIGI